MVVDLTYNLCSLWKQHKFAGFITENRLSEKSCGDFAAVVSTQFGPTWDFSERKLWRWCAAQEYVRDFCLYIMLVVISIFLKKMHALITLFVYIEHFG